LSNFIQITPFMHVRDIQEALAFCTETLGFEVLHRRGNYAYVVREKVGFRLLEETGEDAAPAGNRRFGYYIDVRDVDRLWWWKSGRRITPASARRNVGVKNRTVRRWTA
jgi:catechol 2,3-dioxygenase-like lactoylglutathione lyase family enzyme